ncbi:MAG TPA: cyclic nucleotide-binding domain-containing protein [Deltaproteobacteria bacterium]|nr:cyclic nucleotide-binding domain-containing protein [Deltaproteobacteria bacterium]
MSVKVSLKDFPFFKDFSDDQLSKLAAIANEENYDAETLLYQAGDVARSLYIVKTGKVALFMSTGMGHNKPPMQVTVDMITKSETMGWSAVVEPFVYTLGARCLDNTNFLAFDAFQLRKLMEEDCGLGYKIMQAVAKVIATRLTHTRIILVGERGLSVLTEY